MLTQQSIVADWLAAVAGKTRIFSEMPPRHSINRISLCTSFINRAVLPFLVHLSLHRSGEVAPIFGQTRPSDGPFQQSTLQVSKDGQSQDIDMNACGYMFADIQVS